MFGTIYKCAYVYNHTCVVFRLYIYKHIHVGFIMQHFVNAHHAYVFNHILVCVYNYTFVCVHNSKHLNNTQTHTCTKYIGLKSLYTYPVKACSSSKVEFVYMYAWMIHKHVFVGKNIPIYVRI